jgi:hypothetical protein
MTRIRIDPDQVRTAGLAAVTCGDDLRAQAAQLQALALPAMPAAMAARHRTAIQSAAARIGAVAGDHGAIGQELQVRALAADAADSAGGAAAPGAGRVLASAVSTTATITGVGGAPATVTLTTTGARVAAATSSGLRLTIADALEREPGANVATPVSAPDPHASAHEREAASREVQAVQPVGGPPAAALAQAVAAPVAVAARGGGAALHGDAIDPSALPAGEHRALHAAVVGTPAPVHRPEAHDDDRQDWACWMAASAAHAGLPPALPVMMALARSGLSNLPGASSDVGFFGLDPSHTYAPPGAGVGPGMRPDPGWWATNPDAQLHHVLRGLHATGGGVRTQDLDDPDALGRWAAEALPGADAAQFQDAHAAAGELVSHCKGMHAAAGVGVGSGGALRVAQSQLGVHETGVNTGPEVSRYLAAAGAAPGNPWCASFVTWSLHESGHDMPGHGWAAVSTWVDAAQSHAHGLQLVDPAHARPGDIVAYDWGGGGDFGSDGHIGFLDSHVHDGNFTAVEGNSQDAVVRMDRSMDAGNVVFIRLVA